MNQQQSRKVLVGVLAMGALLLSAPLLWQAWTTGNELNGKVAVFDAPSARPVSDLLGCLVHRPPGGLALTIMAENHFADPARGLVVRIEPQGNRARLTAWISRSAALTTGEAAQLTGCAAG